MKKKAILLGVMASLFFAVTFVLNRLMSVQGGSWIWSSSLRFFWMLPFFFIIVAYRGGLSSLLASIRHAPIQWFLWSTIGFGLFYAPLTFAAQFSPSWLVASTWQITIIAGMLLAPITDKRRSSAKPILKDFLFSGIILLGILMMQINELKSASLTDLLQGSVFICIAAFAYPLGNRKMMSITNGKLDVYQRILGMICCSIPFWILLSCYAVFVDHTLPTTAQYSQTFIVAVFSGVIATALFFSATDMVRKDQRQLAAVEATQSTEVLFALVGEILILKTAIPDSYALSGIVLVIIGMLLHSMKN